MARALLSDIDLLSRLVAFDSTSANSNRPIADFICDYLERPGIRVERLRAADPDAVGDKLNLAVFVGPEVEARQRQGLLLSGHMDVVPATEPQWQSDPFTLLDDGERLIGRGACDMKGFDAIAINAAAEAAQRPLVHPLVLVLTYDEEVGTVGAHDFAQTWPVDRPLPRRAIIGEPTSLAVVRMHKGHAKLRATFTGREAHSGYPHLGTSAVEPAARAITALGALRDSLEHESGPNAEHFPEVPFVALNVGTVNGGSAVNVIPAQCTLEIGIRVLPGMEAVPVLARAKHAIEHATSGGPVPTTRVAVEVVVLDDSPPLLTPEDVDLYRHLCALRGQQQTASVSYATDAGWLQRCGLDCLIFGPGTIEVAHKPNESIPKGELREGGAMFRDLVARYCG